MEKDKQKLCGFFVVPGEGKTLLGMLNVEILELLCVNCKTIKVSQKNRHVNKQRTEDKSNTNKL